MRVPEDIYWHRIDELTDLLRKVSDGWDHYTLGDADIDSFSQIIADVREAL